MSGPLQPLPIMETVAEVYRGGQIVAVVLLIVGGGRGTWQPLFVSQVQAD